MPPGYEARQDRIVIRDLRTKLRNNTVYAGGCAGIYVRAAIAKGIEGQSAGCAAGALRNALAYAAESAAGLGALQVGLGFQRSIALNSDVQVVLERQGDGVLEG